MIMLVHPAPAGNATDPPKGRRRRNAPALSLTAEEARHLRTSTRNIARTYGSLAALARALGVTPVTLTRKGSPGAALAVALARLTRIPVETLISGKLAVVPAMPGGAS